MVCTFLVALAAFSASAQTPEDVVRLEMLPGWRQQDGTHVAALRVTLAPGWKTYWRAPGEAGIPPTFDWRRSRNLGASRTVWPVPEVFTANGMRSVGYSDIVVLPMVFRPARPGADIEIRGRVSLGVCETICIPLEADISAKLPADSRRADPVIRAALADTPTSGGSAGVTRVDCAVAPIEDGLRLTASITMPALGSSEAAIVETADPQIWISDVDTRRRGDTLTATTEMVPPHGAPFALDRSSLRFTILADGRAVEIRGCAAG